MTWLASFFGGIWAKIIAIGAIALAVGLFILKIFNAGKTSERAGNLEKVNERVAQAKKFEQAVRADTDTQLRDRLRKQSSGHK
jgi:hypothetical protein